MCAIITRRLRIVKKSGRGGGISMRIRRYLAVLLLTALLISTLCCPTASASVKVKVNSSSAYVYQKPSSSSKHIKCPAGVKLTCTGYSGSWARVSYKGNTGYMRIQYLNLTNRVKAYTKSSTTVYKKASSSSKLCTISAGSTVYAIGYSGGYVRIQNKSGSQTGYVKSSKLSKNSAYKKSSSGSAKVNSSSSSKLAKVLSAAKSKLGVRYGKGGLDCSGFTRYCYSKIGVKLKGNSKKQANDSRFSMISSISKLKVGDLLYFDTNGDGVCDHSAIYIGSKKFVEASQGAGKIRTKKFDSYYKKFFMWGRRVL